MKTDHAIYQLLSTGREAFRILTNDMPLAENYKFSSQTFKEIERRIDAIFEPESPDETTYIIEFQAQKKIEAWYNLLTKIGLYGEQHPQLQVHGILIFPHHKNEDEDSHWLADTASKLWTAIYLEEFIPNMLIEEPENPFVSVFAPLMLKDESILIKQAPQL